MEYTKLITLNCLKLIFCYIFVLVEPKSDHGCQKEMAKEPIIGENSQEIEIHSNTDVESSGSETTTISKIVEKICDSVAVEETELGDETQISESTDNDGNNEAVNEEINNTTIESKFLLVSLICLHIYKE